jgi:uncharacterized protein YcfJ
MFLGKFANIDRHIKKASAPRDYKREYRLFHSSPEAKRNRAKRNLWNRRLKGKVPAGYEIDHKRQLRDGGGNGRDNIRFMRISKNRAEHNRRRVVRDHMRKESAFKQKRYEVDRDKVRREARKTNKRAAGSIGLLLGGLAGSKLGPVGIAGGALGGGLIGVKAGTALRPSDKTVENIARMYEREINQDKLSDLELAARGNANYGGSVYDREALIRKFSKTASFDPYQWVYDSLVKEAQAIATKRDPAKWSAAKREAKAKMGGKHSARAMQLATQIYKKKGGTYAGKKPSSSSNKLRKWTKQKWKWSGGDTPGEGGKGVYLPKRSAEQLSSTKSGRAKLRQASRVKREATSRGRQFSSHGLHLGKKRSEVS